MALKNLNQMYEEGVLDGEDVRFLLSEQIPLQRSHDIRGH